MKTKYLLSIGATIIIMVLFFSKDKKNRLQKIDTNETEETSLPVANKLSSQDQTTTLSSSDLTEVKSVLPAASTPSVNPKLAENFSAHLKLMYKCLGLTSGIQNIGEATIPTTENLFSQLKSSLGDIVVQMDDWSQTEISDSNAIKKRVRVDYDYQEGGVPNKRLSMYQINSYGMPEIMSLSADEMNNPNQAYIDSLIEGNKVLTEEKGSRSYFAEGEEIVYAVKNGFVQSLSINRGEKSFNCFNLDEEKSNCSCP